MHRVRGGEDRVYAHPGGGGLCDHVTHESDHEDGEDEHGEVAGKGGEITQRHAAADDEVTAQHHDAEGSHAGGKDDDGYQCREESYDGDAQVPGPGVGLHEFIVLHLLGVDHADESSAQDALVDHLVEPVDDFAALYEQRADLAQDDEE